MGDVSVKVGIGNRAMVGLIDRALIASTARVPELTGHIASKICHRSPTAIMIIRVRHRHRDISHAASRVLWSTRCYGLTFQQVAASILRSGAAFFVAQFITFVKETRMTHRNDVAVTIIIRFRSGSDAIVASR